MSVHFDGAGFKAEKIAVEQFGGKLVSEKKFQYRDIDAIIPTKKGVRNTVSVKDQLWSSGKWGCIQIETKLTNTRNGATTEGCFYNCDAKVYFWRVWTERYGDTWLIIPTDRLRAFIEERGATVGATLQGWRTKAVTEAKNRSYNRYYDRAEGIRIRVDELEEIALLKPVEQGGVH